MVQENGGSVKEKDNNGENDEYCEYCKYMKSRLAEMMSAMYNVK